jgi:hypothetical protein
MFQSHSRDPRRDLPRRQGKCVNVSELRLGFSNTTRNLEGILSHKKQKEVTSLPQVWNVCAYMSFSWAPWMTERNCLTTLLVLPCTLRAGPAPGPPPHRHQDVPLSPPALRPPHVHGARDVQSAHVPARGPNVRAQRSPRVPSRAAACMVCMHHMHNVALLLNLTQAVEAEPQRPVR